MRPGAGVAEGVALIRTAKEALPDGWPMFLVWEYGLDELLPYLPDPRVALTTGLQWQRIKGTPASLRMALAWLGINAVVEQETPTGRHWFEYQIDPGKLLTRAEIENLVGLARLSAPVGTRLARVFHGYDMRRFVWDHSSWSDGSLWSNYSGRFDPDLGVYLSFQVEWNDWLEFGGLLSEALVELDIVTRAQLANVPRWDFFAWGDGPGTRNTPPAWEVDLHAAAVAHTPTEQHDAISSTASKAFEQYSWGSATWGDRNWTMPASDAELGE